MQSNLESYVFWIWTLEATQTICIVTRLFKKSCKYFSNQVSSDRPKSVNSEAMLQSMEEKSDD